MQLKRIKKGNSKQNSKPVSNSMLAIRIHNKKLMKSNVVKTNSQKVGICAITLFQRRRSCNV